TGGLPTMKHCSGPVVTVAMDEMSFLEPAYVGDLLTVKAMVNDTGRTSMEVGVRVEAENVVSGRRVHTSSAYLVYVALDRSGKPRPVPPVIVEDEYQRRRPVEARLGPVMLAGLGVAERVRPATLARLAAGLEETGLVVRRTDASDRRVTIVQLSPDGRRLLERTRTRRTAYLTKRLRGLDAEDLAI